MGKYWKVAERYSSILQRVLDEYGEYEQAVGTVGEHRVTPSSVKILADMRRCAFDLDFLISRQPRNQLTVSNTPRAAATPTPAKNLGPNDLEYLDIFGFFNVPRLPTLPGQVQVDGLSSDVANPTPTGGNGTVSNLSIADLTGDTGADTDRANHNHIVSSTIPLANEFNITNYMVPTPETDWLFRNTT